MKYKIFEGGSIRECLKHCLEEGYRPMTLEQTYWYRRENKWLKGKFVDTGTVFFEGKVRKAKLIELHNIEAFYEKGGRLLCLNYAYNGLFGDYNLNNGGRFVGVKIKPRGSKK